MSEDVTVSDGPISGLEARERTSFVNGRVCGRLVPRDQNHLGGSFCSLFFFSLSLSLARTHHVGVNAASAGARACVHACARHASAAAGRVEVQECEIRRWFVEGDNEQSAIFAG